MTKISCQQCNLEYPPDGLPYLCPNCQGIWDQADLPALDLSAVEDRPGIWRYRHTFDLDGSEPIITLGEGDTPLIEDMVGGRHVYYKLESLNPSGSYKDRASAVLINHMINRRIRNAVEDSSGNAGASFAAYAARAGIQARIYVPSTASGPKLKQIELYGSELITIEGPRSAAADAVRKAALGGMPYASHAYLPFGMDGIATIAYEIFESLGEVPGSIIGPAGHGSFLLGVARGFQALMSQGYSQKLPRIVGVQAAACAPLEAAWRGSKTDIQEEATLAEGVRVRNPVRGEALLKVVKDSGGEILSIPEHHILPARDELARRGIYVEPTSAIVWAAFERLIERLPEPVILLLSGTGFKYNN